MKLFARESAQSRSMFRYAGALSLIALLPGCNRNEEALLGRVVPVKPSQVLSGRPVSGQVFTIGVMLPRDSDWSPRAQAGMASAAADNEVVIEHLAAASVGESQQRQAQRLLAAKVNALLVWTVDPDIAANAIRAAKTTRTPVFMLGDASDREQPTAHFVTTAPVANLSPEVIGRTAIDRIAAYLRGEKLQHWIMVRPESNAALGTK